MHYRLFASRGELCNGRNSCVVCLSVRHGFHRIIFTPFHVKLGICVVLHRQSLWILCIVALEGTFDENRTLHPGRLPCCGSGEPFVSKLADESFLWSLYIWRQDAPFGYPSFHGTCTCSTINKLCSQKEYCYYIKQHAVLLRLKQTPVFFGWCSFLCSDIRCMGVDVFVAYLP